MNNRYFFPRLHMLAMLLFLAVFASIFDQWLGQSQLAFELATTTKDASASQTTAKVSLSVRLSPSPPDLSAGSLQ